MTATSSSTGGFVNSYSYNSNGEQTGRTLSGTAYTLAYDYDGQLTSITQGSAVTSFGYDATGRRVTRTAGGTTTRFYYDGGQILTEKQGSTTTAVYTYGEGLIRKDSEYPLFDGQGSERTVTNGSQTVVGTLNLDAFGNSVGITGSSSNPYMYAATSGYRNDGDAGLMHVGARYYDAQVGMFITRDTQLDQKPYLYCEHDPVDGLDPSGHGWRDEWRKTIQAVKLAGTWLGDPFGLGGPAEPETPEPAPITSPARPGGGGKPPKGFKLPPWVGKIDVWIWQFDIMPRSTWDGSILKNYFIKKQGLHTET